MTWLPPISWVLKCASWVRRAVMKLLCLPPRPRDLKLVHGLYWGLGQGSCERNAFCPNCASDGVYVPLTRKDRWADGKPRNDGQVQYTCPKCGRHWFLMLEQEGEALGC